MRARIVYALEWIINVARKQNVLQEVASNAFIYSCSPYSPMPILYFFLHSSERTIIHRRKAANVFHGTSYPDVSSFIIVRKNSEQRRNLS